MDDVVTDKDRAFRQFVETHGPWYQGFTAGGVAIPGTHRTDREAERLLPADMRGQRFVDLGCNAGCFVFEAERRGAEAFGVDCDVQEFRRALAVRAHLGSRASLHHRRIMELEGWRQWSEGFDFVLMTSVFHHLQRPLEALRVIRAGVRPGGRLVAEIPCWSPERPLWKPLHALTDPLGDKVWHGGRRWYPTRECIESALVSFFDDVECVGTGKPRSHGRLVFVAKVTQKQKQEEDETW